MYRSVFQMRKALDLPFFFEFARERSFDLDTTESDFTETLQDSLSSTRFKVFPLVDTSYIQYMYDATRSFLLSRVTILFQDDVIFLPFVKPLVKSLHEAYASIIPLRIQEGIDSEITEEENMTSTSVESSFNRFLNDMEFSFVAELINGSKSSIIQDLVSKIENVYEEFSHLSTDFVREALQPYTFDYFETSTQRFITDDRINYIEMKKFVIDATNDHAATILESTRAAYRSNIESLFDSVEDFTTEVFSDLVLVVQNTKRLDSSRNTLLSDRVQSAKSAMSSFSNTLKGSVLTKLEEVLRLALVELEDAQGTRLHNFFNTKIQLIKDDVTNKVVDKMTAVFENHMDSIEAKMLELSGMARTTFREFVDTLLEMEKDYRSQVVTVSKPALDEKVAFILEEYNYNSFTARQSILKMDLRNTISTSSADLIVDRRLKVLQFHRDWSEARSKFRTHFLQMAQESKASFRQDLVDVILYAKNLTVDIMGEVDEILNALDRDVFSAMENAFTNVVDSVIGSEDNELPGELSMVSVVFTPGIMDLTQSPEIPADAFIRSYDEPDEFSPRDEDGNILPTVDEPSGLTTNELVMLLMDWDLWLQGKVEQLVEGVVISMQEGLIQNTCRNKPPCREGWTEGVNLFGVPCCTFDPVSQGFFTWQLAGMLALEILLALVLDLEDLIDEVYSVAKAASKTGKKALKSAAKAGSKGARVGGKMMAKTFTKYAGKNPARMTKAISTAARMGGKTISKAATRLGQKLATKAAVKLAAKVGAMGTKMLAKLSLGPVGIFLMIFDFVSLTLDLWDPAGYNEQQSAGLLRLERDEIEKYYKDFLYDNGLDHPLLADPMYEMPETEQDELFLEVQGEWFSDKMAEFMKVNDKRFEKMPDYESENEILQRQDELIIELDENPNILTTLLAERLENVFLQDISVRESQINPHTDGGPDNSRTHVFRQLPDSGILEIVLNETGVQAFNLFIKKKAAFLNSLKYNPMYRYVKRKDDYIMTKNSSVAKFMQPGVKCTVEVQNYQSLDYSYEPQYRVIEDCVRPTYPPLTPTLEGSIAFADALPFPNGEFGTEIRANVADG